MSEGPGNHAIRSREFRYIRYKDGFEELYKDSDPWNHTNLAAKPEYAEVLAQHRAHLPKSEACPIPRTAASVSLATARSHSVSTN